jgi:hypothetical protein
MQQLGVDYSVSSRIMTGTVHAGSKIKIHGFVRVLVQKRIPIPTKKEEKTKKEVKEEQKEITKTNINTRTNINNNNKQ